MQGAKTGKQISSNGAKTGKQEIINGVKTGKQGASHCNTGNALLSACAETCHVLSWLVKHPCKNSGKETRRRTRAKDIHSPADDKQQPSAP